jgi:membrane complex biogenesis BtpA family protein
LRARIEWNKGPVLIGVVHLPPLPGSAPFKVRKLEDNVENYINDVIEFAISEAKKLEEAEFNAVIIENYGDAPYYVNPPEPVKVSLALIVKEVNKELKGFPIGLSLLRNSPKSLIEIALLTGASFVRINALCSLRISPEGIIGPGLAQALEAFSELGEDPSVIDILADVDVKHSLPISPKYSPLWEIKECASRKGPLNVKALIVSGERTGEPPDLSEAMELKRVANSLGFKLIIGSGISLENAKAYKGFDGYIIGTSLKESHEAGSPIVVKKAKALASVLRG